MILSNRALGILGLSLLVLLVALVSPWLAYVAAAIDLALLVACIVDARSAGASGAKVLRTLPGTFYQGTPVDLAWEVEGNATVVLRDPLSPGITPDTLTLTLTGPARHVARVTPPRRGAIDLGPVSGLVLGPLGLVWRGRVWAPPCTVRVLPRVQFDGEDGLYLRGQLQSRASARPDRRRGQSGELHALRDYVPGDDVRRMHWASTARFGRPIVSDLEWERHRHVVLLLDAGRAMGALDGAAPKLDAVLAALLALLRVAVVNEDHVTVVLYSRTIRRVIHTGKGAWSEVFDALHAEHADGLPSDHLAAAAWVGAHVRRRSLVVVFTSVGDAAAAPSLPPALAALRRRHRTVLVDLEDPAVVAAVRRPPTDEATLCEMASAWSVRARNDAAATRLRHQGIDVLRTGADGLMVRAVQRYLELRAEG